MIPFVKMHGCGNDFVVVREADLPEGTQPDHRAEFVRRVCERRFGIGADGLLAYSLPDPGGGGSHLRMAYWNNNGERAEMCGNGARCLIRLAYDRGEAPKDLQLETDAGVRAARVILESTDEVSIEINMGAADWRPTSIPVTSDSELIAKNLEVAGQTLRVTALSMGNPHAIVFLAGRAALDTLSLEVLGAALAQHPAFPAGANASFACVEEDQLHLRVWERGVGPTLACGTASCAVTAAAIRLGRISRRWTTVHQPGGRVQVRLDEHDELWMKGPARYVAEGTIADELLRDVAQ